MIARRPNSRVAMGASPARGMMRPTPLIAVSPQQLMLEFQAVQRLFRPSDIAALFDPVNSALYSAAAGTTPAVVGGPVAVRLDVARGVMALGPELLTSVTPTVAANSSWDPATRTMISRRVALTTDGDVTFAGVLTAGALYVVTHDSYSAIDGYTLFAPIVYDSTTVAVSQTDNAMPLRYFIAPTGSNLIFRQTANGRGCQFTGLSLRRVFGNHASQPTTSLCPILRETPTTKRRWLETPDADDALNLTFASAPGACDVGVLNGNGTFTWTRQTLGATVNVVTRFALNAFWIMRQRAFESHERVLIERYARRHAPLPGEWS